MKTLIQSPIRQKKVSMMFLFCALLLLIALSSCNRNNSTTENVTENASLSKTPTMAGGDTIWTEVDQMPVFPGGDEALLKYIAENVKYPDAAKKDGTQGRVIVRFLISSRGNVTNCEIIKSVSKEIDAESLRVVQSLPDFEPGKVDGKVVAVWYMVPITFALR